MTPCDAQLLGIGGSSKPSGKTVIVSAGPIGLEDYRIIMGLAASGELRPVIDRAYDLDDAAVAQAWVNTSRKRGSVVLTVGAASLDTAPPSQ